MTQSAADAQKQARQAPVNTYGTGSGGVDATSEEVEAAYAAWRLERK